MRRFFIRMVDERFPTGFQCYPVFVRTSTRLYSKHDVQGRNRWQEKRISFHSKKRGPNLAEKAMLACGMKRVRKASACRGRGARIPIALSLGGRIARIAKNGRSSSRLANRPPHAIPVSAKMPISRRKNALPGKPGVASARRRVPTRCFPSSTQPTHRPLRRLKAPRGPRYMKRRWVPSIVVRPGCSARRLPARLPRR